jgi:hypothetical protein
VQQAVEGGAALAEAAVAKRATREMARTARSLACGRTSPGALVVDEGALVPVPRSGFDSVAKKPAFGWVVLFACGCDLLTWCSPSLRS